MSELSLSRPACAVHDTMVPGWLWLHLPVASFLALHLAAGLAPGFYLDWLIPEDGVIEAATPLLLVVAIGYAVSAMRRGAASSRTLRIWLTLFVLGCIYFAGEEISWGQRIFGWATPDSWQALNKQEETNLHNVSALFDSKPRLLMSLGVLMGGIVYPLSARARHVLGRLVPGVLWPSRICMPAAMCALAAGTGESVARFFGFAVPRGLSLIEAGEVKELYIAFFLTLYASSLTRSLIAVKDRARDRPHPLPDPRERRVRDGGDRDRLVAQGAAARARRRG